MAHPLRPQRMVTTHRCQCTPTRTLGTQTVCMDRSTSTLPVVHSPWGVEARPHPRSNTSSNNSMPLPVTTSSSSNNTALPETTISSNNNSSTARPETIVRTAGCRTSKRSRGGRRRGISSNMEPRDEVRVRSSFRAMEVAINPSESDVHYTIGLWDSSSVVRQQLLSACVPHVRRAAGIPLALSLTWKVVDFCFAQLVVLWLTVVATNSMWTHWQSGRGRGAKAARSSRDCCGSLDVRTTAPHPHDGFHSNKFAIINQKGTISGSPDLLPGSRDGGCLRAVYMRIPSVSKPLTPFVRVAISTSARVWQPRSGTALEGEGDQAPTASVDRWQPSR